MAKNSKSKSNSSSYTKSGAPKNGSRNHQRRSGPKRDNYRPDDTRNRNAAKSDSNAAPARPEAMNDISWYSRNPNLLLAAGSFPYPYRPGMDIGIIHPWKPNTPGTGTNTEYPPIKQINKVHIPGVLSLSWIPTLGVSTSATDPATIAGKEMYARVRAAFSGTLRADAPDYVIYLMCLDSLFSYIGWLKRVYRTLSAWSPENYALPDRILNAMGLYNSDISSLREGKTRLWQYINELVLQSRKFTCPAVMDIFNRHYWMSDNVYTDAPTIASQMYLFNLRAVHKFKMVDSADPTPVPAPGTEIVELPQYIASSTAPTVMTPEIFYSFGRSLIDALVEWDDSYQINGYLMKAYQGAPQFVVAEIAQDEMLTPVYVEEVLTQIENSRTIPGATSYYDPTTKQYDSIDKPYANFGLYQSVTYNTVISNPKMSVFDFHGMMTYGGWKADPMLSIRSDSPTVADNVIATRLQATVLKAVPSADWKDQTDADPWELTISCGTEVPLGWKLIEDDNAKEWTWDPNVPFRGGIGRSIPQVPVYTIVDTGITADSLDYLKLIQFDWHPFIVMTALKPNVSGTEYVIASPYVIGDTHNITVISREDLINLHRVCVLSELNAFDA